MATVGEDTIETAALGRPFHLGMLYDCRKDTIVPGITLWDREQLQQNTVVRPHINTEFSVTTSDTIEEKAKHLKVDGELKLSLLGGTVKLSGAAKYFNDSKKSFIQERLMLHYRTSTKFEQLTMNHLAHGKMEHHDVFDNDVATHVVTAVQYGADAYFVFDREVDLSEHKNNVHGEVKVALDKLKILSSGGAQARLNLNESEKAAVKKLSCTFYGDFMLPSNPTTFEDAVKVYTDLPKMLGENGEHAVPVTVWLYPLVKLDSRSAKLQRNISRDLIRAVESVIEALNVIEMKCGDLLQDTVAKSFSTFHNRVQDFQKFCSECKRDFMTKLGSVLPEIRGGKSDIIALCELLDAHENSPFNIRVLQQWIEMKGKKSNQVKTLLKQLHELGAEVDDDIDKYLLDLEVESLVSYAFTCLQSPDHLMTEQEIYLNPSLKKRISENTLDQDFQEKLWTSDDLICMKNNLLIFKNLVTSNNSQSTKFIVQSVPHTSNYPSSCILVYENGCNEAICFVPPSKPTCPIIEDITDNSIRVRLSSPCAATLKRKLLYKTKDENDWKSQPVQEDLITLTDLKQGTDYEIKCGAVGKLDYTVESDAVKLKTAKRKLTQNVDDFQLIQLVLLGRTRSDKAAAKNTILGREESKQCATSAATTTESQQIESTQGEVAGRKVTVLETPDWLSPGISLKVIKEIVGIQAFLLVIPLKPSEDKEVYTVEESQVRNTIGILEEFSGMEELFGKGYWGNTMILFTITDEILKMNNKTFIQTENQAFQSLAEKCGNRFHCLNIKESGDGSQVSELLEKIEKMVEGNGNTSEIIHNTRETMT